MIKNKYEVEGDVCRIHVIQRNGREHEVRMPAEKLVKLTYWSNLQVFNDKSGKFYAVLTKQVNGKQIKCYLHRLVMDASDGLVVDHINGDTLDNRKENLRLATAQQNNENKAGAQKNNTSGIRGVNWDSHAKKWRARAMIKGKYHNLGLFNNIKEAEEVVCAFRQKHMPFSEMDKAA